MNIKQLVWHFITHFSIAFTATILVVLGYNWFANGTPDVNSWGIPMGIGVIVGIVTTLMHTGGSEASA